MELPENPYGIRKRLRFVEAVIRRAHASHVLDVGCGTGEYLTRPLAARLPDVVFTGTDMDDVSLAAARATPGLPNLVYLAPHELPAESRYGVVIASEVIEHVHDPVAFLMELRRRLSPGGELVLTLPNGLGPAELASLLEDLLRATGVFARLRLLKRKFCAPQPLDAAAADSLADSPHVSFFTLRDIREVCAAAGLAVEQFQARTWLCGFGLDVLLKPASLARWNARVADALPPTMVSDWMLVLKEAAEPLPVLLPAPSAAYRTRRYARLRRWVHVWRRRAASGRRA